MAKREAVDALFDDYDDEVEAKDGGSRNWKPGRYLILTQPGLATYARSGMPMGKLGGTVLKVLEDYGDSNDVGDEGSHALFRDKRYKFFERDTKLYVKGALNLTPKEATDWDGRAVRDFLFGRPRRKKDGKVLAAKPSQFGGRVLEIRVAAVPPKGGSDEDGEEPKKGNLIRVFVQRGLTRDEAAREVPKQVLRRYCPKGIVEPEAQGE